MKIKKKMLPTLGSDMIDFSNLAWASATSYSVGHPVEYLGNFYICKTGHTSGASFDPAKFELISKGTGYHFSAQTETVSAAPEDFVISNDISTGGPRPFILKDMGTTWEEAVQGTDYSISFKDDLSEMTVSILVNGDFKINY